MRELELKPDRDITDSRLVKALAHPLRVRILGALDERMASPSELAAELNAPLGNVSYHVRILASLGLITLVKETPRSGSVEHHYEAVARPVVSDEAWAAVPETVKRAMVGAALEQAGLYVTAAAASGGFNRSEAHLSRTPLALDAQGWEEVSEELRTFLERMGEVAQEAENRLAQGGEHAEGDAAMLLLMLFGSSGLDEQAPSGGGEETEHRTAPSAADAARRA